MLEEKKDRKEIERPREHEYEGDDKDANKEEKIKYT